VRGVLVKIKRMKIIKINWVRSTFCSKCSVFWWRICKNCSFFHTLPINTEKKNISIKSICSAWRSESTKKRKNSSRRTPRPWKPSQNLLSVKGSTKTKAVSAAAVAAAAATMAAARSWWRGRANTVAALRTLSAVSLVRLPAGNPFPPPSRHVHFSPAPDRPRHRGGVPVFQSDDH